MQEVGFKIGVKRIVYNYELRNRREALGLSQAELQEKAFLAKSVSEIETFKYFPTPTEAATIADILDCDVSDIFPEWTRTAYNKDRKLEDQVISVTPLSLEAGEVLQLQAPAFTDPIVSEKALEDFLAVLPPRDRKILTLRFGLFGEASHTLEEVGHVFGSTRERIRQIEAKALKRLERSREAIKMKATIQEIDYKDILKKEEEYDREAYKRYRSRHKYPQPFTQWREEYLAAPIEKRESL